MQLNSLRLAWDLRYKVMAVDLPGARPGGVLRSRLSCSTACSTAPALKGWHISGRGPGPQTQRFLRACRHPERPAGFGNTEHLPYVDNNMRAEFIKACLDFALGGRNLTAVLVVPSMSGCVVWR